MTSTEFWDQLLAELRSIHNIIHGPEIWLVFPVLMLIVGAIGFFVFYYWSDNND